ncbi:MAG: MOSC domain-containing protein [Alphaproteobacteria bacterium]|nr:MOSC domain-containing protein [Alphaproteobacteria bacterium]
MQVKSLHIYPVKAMQAIDMIEAPVETRGLSHDRRWMLVDANGRFISQREQPKLAQVKVRLSPAGLFLSAPEQPEIFIATPDTNSAPLPVTIWKDNVQAYPAAGEAQRWCSDFLGIPCRLVYQGDGPRAVSPAWGKPGDENSFADSAPLLITTTASLAGLNRRMGKTIPMDRFRPNIVIDCDEAWAEDIWHTIRIGGVELELIKPCTRCAVTTTDQETGARPDNEPLATLKTFRLIRQPHLTGVVFGQNAVARKTGMIKAGDTVEILSTRPAPDYLL